MFSLRSYKQAIPRRPLPACPIYTRHFSAESHNQPVRTGDAPQKEGTQLTEVAHTDVLTAEVISGAPAELRHRMVRIYQPARNTMQSGAGKSERWRIDWDILPGAGRWENPLMGWASSADYMQGTRVSFKSKEDAMHFAEKQGWNYYVQPPPAKKIPPKNYSENFVYKPSTLRIMRTK
ncbi:Ndufs4, NADH dehydrogenase Fe-S protein 4 [Suillus bovinus]|uniref:Ndufs4, NADH dehydrogenase Fe-S protein 4 n=1 Tax=Suillus bovinus TaxID=48563 RepID=UPI001B8705B1|nr:Ndufs4, NADH dehydrogenase Fe-S protein 4 [Suillus bovinus]KAG2153125.1 Ndufs4, NADH dehydrogenase Fe-S protein 4 [Suillus bovinus]